MDPFTIAAILKGVGGFGKILGGFGLGSEEVPYQNANSAYTDAAMQQFQSLLGNSDNQMDNYMRQAGEAASGMGGAAGDLERLQGLLAGTQGPNVNEGYNLYKSREGGIVDQARAMAEMFTQPYRETAGDTANRRADQAARGVMGQFGGQGFSGAAQAAASGAAGDVLSNYESNIANMFGNMGSTFAGNMLGAERGMAEAAPQQNFANTINSLLNQGNMAQNRGTMFGNQSSMFGNIGSNYGNRSNQLLGGIAGLSAPQYAEQVTANPFLDSMSAVDNFGSDFFGLAESGSLDNIFKQG